MDSHNLSTAPLYTPTPDWLRPALGEGLAQVREHLAAYQGEDPTPLRAARDELHRQRGILTIAQWHGAALVSEELEATLGALLEERVDSTEEAMEAVVQGLNVLDNYLRHMGLGHPDQPMALLPVLNELRAVRQAELLSAGLLMRLDVDTAAPPVPQGHVDIPVEALTGTLRRLHTYYQSALLAWYRDTGEERALGQLKAVLDCLMDSACGEANRRLWWVAGGAVEALGQSTLSPTLPLRRLLGQVERHLHTLVRSPAPELEHPSSALIKDLLYYIAQAAPASPRVQHLHEAYQLNRAVPSPTYLAALSEAISAPEREAYAVLAQGLLDDLQILQARIEHAAHHPLALGHEVDDTVARLRSLADSLALLGLGGQRELLHNAIAALEQAPRAALEDLALALIHVEAALRQQAEGDHAEVPPPGEGLPDHEYRQVIHATIREARRDLAQIRNGLLAYLLSQRPEQGLPEIPRQLDQLRGALVLLGHERVANQIEALRRYVTQDLLHADTPPTPLALDMLADALVTLEHYLDAVEGERRQLSPLLNSISRCLAVLGHPVSPSLATLPETIPTLNQPVSAEHSPPLANVVPLPMDDMDDEVAAIFVEEAHEVSQELEELRPHLGKRRPDTQLLDRLRHGFHTLKGSGRIAGAEELGRYAQTMETLLNRLSSGALSWHPALGEFLSRAIALLPTLVEAFDRHRPFPREGEALISAAEQETWTHPATPEDRPPHPEASSSTPEPAPLETADRDGEGPEPEAAVPTATPREEQSRPDEERITSLAHQEESTAPAVTTLLEALVRTFADVHDQTSALQALEALADHGRRHDLGHLVDFSLRVRALVEDGLEEIPDLLAREVPPRLVPLAPPPAWETLAARLTALLRPTPPSRQAMMLSEDVDPALATIFLEEARELMELMDPILPSWKERQRPPAHQIQQVQRALHTLKGGARVAGLSDIGDTAHVLEAVMEALDRGEIRWTAPLRDAVQEALDHLAEALDQIAAGDTPLSGESLRQRLETALHAPETDAQRVSSPAEVEVPVDQTSIPAQAPSPAGDEHEALRSDTLRIATDTLDELVNLSKEDGLFNIRAREQHALLKSHLDELGKTIDRLRSQIRALPTPFSPLGQGEADPNQALLETLEDLSGLHTVLHQLNMESGRVLNQQHTVQRNLQGGLVEARMIPFSSHLPRLQRLVRQVARELGKEARLELAGASGRLDRATLERLAGPLEHLIRNALAHGIETSEERLARGKPASGLIRIGFAREGDEQIITVSDDGRGIDPRKVMERARQKGLSLPESLTPQTLLELLARPGFSTAEQVDQVAGRGIGLDAVLAEVRELGGRMELDSRPGQGTTFTLRIPFTLGMSRCVLVEVQGNVYALPAQHVVQVLQVSREELTRLYQRAEPVVIHDDETFRFTFLAGLLNLPDAHPTSPGHLVPLILIRHQGHRLALHVDHLLGSRELVLKGDSAPLTSEREGVLGATVLGDGRVALVLDVAELVTRPLPDPSKANPTTRPHPRVRHPGGPVEVLVVDDSITVRKVTERLLTRHQMKVRTARDGLEALERLEESVPDILLLDIEMPRMDGFELAERIRNSDRWRDLPIIMISSRSGPRQRARALQLGVDRFLSKPYQETVLVAQIEALTHSLDDAEPEKG